MDYISIAGIGVISNLGNDVDTVWDNLLQDNEISKSQGAISFDSGLNLSQRTKSNRYSEMGYYVSKMAIHDAKVDVNNMNKKRTGTVFTTGWGPIVSTLKFSESVIKGDYEFCSPTVFANSVYNACAGHICMLLGFKGVSSVLMGGNNLAYSQMLMSKGDTDYILTGSIEEYCEELHNALALHEISKSVFIKEGAVSFFVKGNDHTGSTYCDMVDFLDCNIGKYPLTNKVDETKAMERIKRITDKLAGNYNIDVFFSSGNGLYFDDIELKATQSVLKKDVIHVNNIKRLFGETLGSAFNMNIMAAALCIKNSKLPLKLDSAQRKVKCALVSGYDISGNYMLTVLKG